MIPIKKILYAALAISMALGVTSDADDTESQKITREQNSGLILKGQLSKNIYKVEKKQESYEVDVPYEEKVEYTVSVPYEDTETYEEQVPYEGTETYEVDVPYEGTETYEEQVPYETQEAYDEQIPYEDRESYQEQIPYEDTETYQDTETTYTTERVCENVTDYRESCQTEKICRKNPVQDGTCTVERVCRERNGQQICFEQKKCNPSTGGDEVCTDKNVCRREPYTKQECSNRQVPHTHTVTKTRTVTKYRSETRYRTVTRYRTETRYRNVTKYRSETRTRTVTLHRRETRTRTVTMYRTEQRVRTVVRHRDETRCCKTETRVRKETRCCVTRDVTVLDHVWNLPYTIRFPEAAKLEADESEIITAQIKGTEATPDVDLHIDSHIFTYKIDKSTNAKEAQIALTVVPHLEVKDMGEGTITDFKALYHPDGYILTFKDIAVFRRIITKYKIQIVDSEKKVIWEKETDATSQIGRFQTDVQLDESRAYTVQIATQRTGVILKSPVQFITGGKLEITKYGKEEVGEHTVTEPLVESREQKKILIFEDKGHINKIETKYSISVVNADLEKVVFQKDISAKDVLAPSRKVELDLTAALEDTRPTYRIVVSVSRTGAILKERVQFRKLTEIKNKIDLEGLKKPELLAGVTIKGNGPKATITILDRAPETKSVRNTYYVTLKRKTLGIERTVAEARFDKASFGATALKDLTSSQVERYFESGAKLTFEITLVREDLDKKPTVVIAKVIKKFDITVK